MQQYKNVFDFIYKTLGYSPGGTSVLSTGLVSISFNHGKISPEDFVKLTKAWEEYKAWEISSEVKPEKLLPNVNFSIVYGQSQAEKFEASGLKPKKIGDTIVWEE